MVRKPRQKSTSVNMQLLINGQNLARVKETSLLGVGENLNW